MAVAAVMTVSRRAPEIAGDHPRLHRLPMPAVAVEARPHQRTQADRETGDA